MGAGIRQRVTLNASSIATSRTLTLPQAPLVGSTLLLALATPSGAGATLPTGWSSRASNTAGSANTYLWDKISAGNETGVTFTQTSGGCNAWLYEVTGLLNPGADVAAGSNSATATVTATTAATTAANDWLFAITTEEPTGATLTSLSNVTLDGPLFVTTNSPTNANTANTAVGYADLSNASGATLTSTATWSVTGQPEIVIASYKTAPVTALAPVRRIGRRR